MKLLATQEELEQLLGRAPVPEGVRVPDLSIIYFTATWCGACRRLDMAAIEAAFPEANWLKCDVDANNYSSGFCGVRTIPAFVIIYKGKATAPYGNSNTAQVMTWIHTKLVEMGCRGATSS